MQIIFFTDATPEEYHRLDKKFPFPQPSFCPSCRVPVAPKKHGFYWRYLLTINFKQRIRIRRYYCPYCKKTLSYLPSFCLPHFQYALEIIYFALQLFFVHGYSARLCISLLRQTMNDTCSCWDRAHLQFYVRRFLGNHNRIKIALRQLLPSVILPAAEMDKKKGAKWLLDIVATGFPHIQTFSTRYYDQCRQSFLAPCKLF